MRSRHRELWIALAVFGPILAVILLWRPESKISFFDLRVVNDTHRSVRIQPCWDIYCLDTHGLTSAVVAPGKSVQDGGHFPTDRGGVVVVAIRKPGGKPWQFSGCMITTFAPQQNTGVVRVSRERECFSRSG